MRQYASALSDANNAISYDSTYVKGYYRKAMVLIEEKDYVGAKEALDQGHRHALITIASVWHNPYDMM